MREWYGPNLPGRSDETATAPSVFSVQKLHLVGFTTDHKSLILSARRGARSGGFVLDVSEELGAAVRQALESAAAVDVPEGEVLEPAEVGPPRPQSALSVRELQARLRSGRTIESVANEAGVDVEWVTRFAAPVLAEQIRVIEATRAATYSRARLGPSALPLGASVYRNLAAKGVSTTPEELDRGWTTRQLSDGRWVVTFTYVSRGRRQKPSWEIDLRSGEVRARDRVAADLSFIPGAPRPASATAAPTKPAKVPAASLPTDVDRANAKRVAEARKAAEAQLADAARRSARRSNDAAKRANTPKAAAERARRRAAAMAAAELAALEAADAEAEVAPDATVSETAAAPRLVTAEDIAATGATSDDPALSAVAMVREAAQALLSDFATGRLIDDDGEEPEADDSAVPTWDDLSLDEAWADGTAEEVDDGEELTGHEADDDVEAAVDLEEVEATEPAPPARIRREPEVAPVPTRRRPVVQAAPPPPVDPRSRSLTAAATPSLDPADAGRRLRLRREERVVRTPIDLTEVQPTLRPGPAFRDDLAVPANRNGSRRDEVPDDFADLADESVDFTNEGEEDRPAQPPRPRRRRTEPLRAR